MRTIVGGMLTPAAPPALKERAVAWGMRVDGSFAAALLRNHAHQDWRRQIGRIDIPTLVVAGRASVVPWTAAEWIAHKIRGARLEIFEPDEGGSHLLALENPARFNRLLSEFVVAGAPNTTILELPLSTQHHLSNLKEQRYEPLCLDRPGELPALPGSRCRRRRKLERAERAWRAREACATSGSRPPCSPGQPQCQCGRSE